jgi:hypothetical protein
MNTLHKTELTPVASKPNYFILTIDGLSLGEWEASELRNHIGLIDNRI